MSRVLACDIQGQLARSRIAEFGEGDDSFTLIQGISSTLLTTPKRFSQHSRSRLQPIANIKYHKTHPPQWPTTATNPIPPNNLATPPKTTSTSTNPHTRTSLPYPASQLPFKQHTAPMHSHKHTVDRQRIMALALLEDHLARRVRWVRDRVD